MKKFIYIFFIISLVIGLYSCDGDNPIDVTDNNDDYFPLSAGSVWNYDFRSDGKSLMSKDSVSSIQLINNKHYTEIFTRAFLNSNPYDYRTYYRRSIDTIFVLEDNVENIFLIEVDKATWTVNTSNSQFTVSDVFMVMDIDEERTVNGTLYKDVVHVHKRRTVTVQGVNTVSEYDLFFSKNVGLIEYIVPTGNIYLIGYTIK